MAKTNSILHTQYNKSIEVAHQFYEKNKLIIEEYKVLNSQFEKDLWSLVMNVSKKRAIVGRDDYDIEKELELNDYQLLKVKYIPEKDKVKILYRGLWTDADTRELYVEPEDLDLLP